MSRTNTSNKIDTSIEPEDVRELSFDELDAVAGGKGSCDGVGTVGRAITSAAGSFIDRACNALHPC